jgi:RNA polymerase sigma-70 factor (ECF subfamily)
MKNSNTINTWNDEIGCDSPNDLRILIRKAVKGDKGAFEQLYLRVSRNILYNVYNMLDSKKDVEDVAQEVVISMYKGIKNLRKPDAFHAWLYSIIRFACYHHNTKSPAKSTMLDLDDYAFAVEDHDPDISPDQLLLTHDRNKRIIQAINNLPQKQRVSLIMRYYNDMTYREIAKTLGSTVSTVSTNIMRAKKKIEGELTKEGLYSKKEAIFALMIQDALSENANRLFPSRVLDQFGATCKTKIEAMPTNMRITSSNAVSRSVNRIIYPVAASAIGLILLIVIPLWFPADAEPSLSQQASSFIEQGEQPFEPEAEILFSGGEASADNIDPQQAHIFIADKGTTLNGWIVTDEAGNTICTGTGEVAEDEIASLSAGDYRITWLAIGKDGNTAKISRTFEKL